MKKIATLFLALSLFLPVFCGIPKVTNVYRKDYGADNKNWSIAQDGNGTLYFANDAGLLEFDGFKWSLHKLTQSSSLKSVTADALTVYTGGYEQFGRWDRDAYGKLNYTSLSDSISNRKFYNDEFWKIWVKDKDVYFQSFPSIYVYTKHGIKVIDTSKNFLFLSKIRNELIVQEMKGRLYRLNHDKLEEIKGSEIFENTDVRVILPYAADGYLVGTASHGIFVYDGHKFEVWNSSLSGVMKKTELNCGLLLSRGTYLFGTILNGIYEVDSKGNLLNHISSYNTLQNNTILALYEDNLQNIWVALDRGISYIQYTDNMDFYLDYTGNTGAVYDAIEWNGKLLIGTNQGVFYLDKKDSTKGNALSMMKLVEGTQGQVWSFKVIDGRLFCAHNSMLKEIHPNMTVSTPYDVSGIFHINQESLYKKDLLLLSSYVALKIIDKTSNEVFELSEISEPIISTEVDHLGNIWMEHAYKGIYKGKLNPDLKSFDSYTYYGGDSDDGLPYKLKMFKVGGRIVLLGNNTFYTYDDIADKIVENSVLNECFENITQLKKVVHIDRDQFWAISDHVIYKFMYDGQNARILESYDIDNNNLSLVSGYENIAVLNDSAHLICLDNGFMVYHPRLSGDKEKLPKPYIKSFLSKSNVGTTELISVSGKISLPHNFNFVTLEFSVLNAYASNLSFQYKLEGVDKEWLTVQKENTVSYDRLASGEYEFQLKAVDSAGNESPITSVSFEIRPPWYQTIWAYAFYVLAFIGLIYSVRLLILRHYRNVYIKKIKRRETFHLKRLTENLRQEIDVKNAEMLTQTSFIVHKNELLQKIQNIVDEFYKQNKNTSLLPLKHKITALLNKGLDSEDDWKMFLIKFEEKHMNFFSRMKALYPDLTSSDLRLCACLKLNLDTKEIAALMNLSVRAVENNRYRLRKKFKLESSQNLIDFVVAID